MTVTSSGRRRGRPPKAAAGDTKEELLQAALALFAAKGYEGTSVRDIARSVGLSESVLYAHFESGEPGTAVRAVDGGRPP